VKIEKGKEGLLPGVTRCHKQAADDVTKSLTALWAE
jgi:hypothetical protein